MEEKANARLGTGIDNGHLQLADLIDGPALQSLLEDLYRVVGLPLGILDLRGEVLVKVGWQEICTRFHRVHPETSRHCMESDTELTHGIAPGEVRLYRCKNRMLDIATPIVVDGQHLGHVFSGQFFFVDEPPDRELFRAQARRYGFAEDDYLCALDAVPRLSRDAVGAGMKLFINIARMISDLSYANLKLAQSLAERETLAISLRERDELLHSVWEGTGDAIFVKDLHGRWQMANPAALRVVGKTLGEVVGNSDGEIFGDPELARSIMSVNRRIIATGQTEVVEELVKTPEGPRVFLVTKSPRFAADGTVIGVIGIAHDITERKRAEEEIIAAKRAAEEANRAKSEFLANMSHEIRTPMTVFMAAVEHLLQIDDHPARRDLLTMANQSSQRLHALIDEILDFSRIEARRVDLEEREFDLRECVREVVAMLTTKAREKNLHLETVISSGIPEVVIGDRHRLGQILLNLVGNAVKFTPAGEVRVAVEARDQHLEFAISDTGIGIPAGKINLLFQSFSQIDGSLTRQFGGTGLGLAICKGLVELMGGRIGVASREGKGSVFTFTVPLKTPDRPHEQVAEELCPGQGYPRLKPRILLVEDEPMVRQMLQLSLIQRGWQSETAANGKEGVRKWEQGEFDVILMDLQMPEMDGLRATRAIRQAQADQEKRTPIIGLTAHARREVRGECLAAGMDHVLLKPVHIDVLYRTIELCCKRPHGSRQVTSPTGSKDVHATTRSLDCR